MNKNDLSMIYGPPGLSGKWGQIKCKARLQLKRVFSSCREPYVVKQASNSRSGIKIII